MSLPSRPVAPPAETGVGRVIACFLQLPYYWRLQLPGLLVVWLTGIIYCFGYYGYRVGATLAMATWALFVSAVLMEALHVYYRRLNHRHLGDLEIIVRVVIVCVGAGLFTSTASIGFDLAMRLNVPGGHTLTRYVTGVFSTGMFYTAWSVLYFALKRSRAAAEAREKLRETEALATQAELTMLRYQLNPHFLFNSLTSLRGQILADPAKAREMTGELADYLRYTLLHSERQEMPLGEEVEAIGKYLALEKIRFEERLEVRIEIDPAARSLLVPTFLLQPLVENAFKHGASGRPGAPLRLSLVARLHEGELHLHVANRGQWRPPAPGTTGVGLANLRRRLEMLYPGRHAFQIAEEAGNVVAHIRLTAPLP